MDLLIKTSSFSSPDKKLWIRDGELHFNKKSILLESVTGLKYGVEGIRFDMFRVGTKYEINLKSKETEIRIILKSYFGYSNSYFTELYQAILKEIWDLTTVRLYNNSIENILDGGVIDVGNCQISGKGIALNGFLIEWGDLTYQKKYDKLTVNSKLNSKIWTNLYYLSVYNVDVLMSILDWVFEYDGLKELEKNNFAQQSAKGHSANI